MTQRLLRVLLSNDDGYSAPGIKAIAKALVNCGCTVKVSAPRTNQSGMSHKMSFFEAINVQRVKYTEKGLENVEAIAVCGTPVDCVEIGLSTFVGFTPDIIVSGINNGNNVGIAALFSGTVGAACEGSIRGIPSVALSADVPIEVELGQCDMFVDWDKIAAALSRYVFIGYDSRMPKFHFISVNFPNITEGFEKCDCVVTAQGFGALIPKYHVVTNADQSLTYSLKDIETVSEHEAFNKTKVDFAEMKNNRVAITPLTASYNAFHTEHMSQTRLEWTTRLEGLCRREPCEE